MSPPEADDAIVFPEGMGELADRYVRDGVPFIGLPTAVVRDLLSMAVAGVALRIALDDRELPMEVRALRIFEAVGVHQKTADALYESVMAAARS